MSMHINSRLYFRQISAAIICLAMNIGAYAQDFGTIVEDAVQRSNEIYALNNSSMEPLAYFARDWDLVARTFLDGNFVQEATVEPYLSAFLEWTPDHAARILREMIHPLAPFLDDPEIQRQFNEIYRQAREIDSPIIREMPSSTVLEYWLVSKAVLDGERILSQRRFPSNNGRVFWCLWPFCGPWPWSP